ncbi:unnamed protein product [Heterotrigona itama]|uniref:Uncharacterized protein n=1 Tax=Heterotrigona itama TaxID=395501 RepID=A0A6V7H7J7_9HYME|nr:unnamed protein product [Heterotrigona itama]
MEVVQLGSLCKHLSYVPTHCRHLHCRLLRNPIQSKKPQEKRRIFADNLFENLELFVIKIAYDDLLYQKT